MRKSERAEARAKASEWARARKSKRTKCVI